MSYVGRFAPSPTGPLHFGSLVAAVASYCDAKSQGGKWLLRMEDLDKPREVSGAADEILRSLQAFGFEWDDTIIYQSQRAEIYAEALNQLQKQNIIYACTCTRKEIADSTSAQGIDGLIYPKTCLNKALNTSASVFNASASRINTGSWRINTDDATNIDFEDAIQGNISQHLQTAVGDFILKRKDGLFAYQLAVVVDDAAQDVTHIVRGADLLASTPRQIYLQQLLGFKTPSYAHIPIAVNNVGEKLSKQTLAQPISMRSAGHQLFDALSFLGQNPPAEMQNATLNETWRWAIKNWQLKKVPKSPTLSKNHT